MGLYIEFPMEIKNSMKNLNEKDRTEFIMHYRDGKYNEIIEKNIIELFNRKE